MAEAHKIQVKVDAAVVKTSTIRSVTSDFVSTSKDMSSDPIYSTATFLKDIQSFRICKVLKKASKRTPGHCKPTKFRIHFHYSQQHMESNKEMSMFGAKYL